MKQLLNNSSFISFFQNTLPQLQKILLEFDGSFSQNYQMKYGLNNFQTDMAITKDSHEKQMNKCMEECERLDLEIMNQQQLVDESDKVMEHFQELFDSINLIRTKESSELKQLKKDKNDLVDMMIEKEENNCNKEVKQLNNQINNLNNEIIEKNKRLDQKIKELKKFKTINKYSYVSSQIQHKHMDSKGFWIHLNNLREWSGHYNYNLIYDTDEDGCDNEIFGNRLMNKNNLYIINIDEKGNIFGCYCNNSIKQMDVSTFNSIKFVFSLQNSSSLKPLAQRWKLKDLSDGSITLWKNKDCLYGIGGDNGWVAVHKTHLSTSRCCSISKWLNNIEDDGLNGTYWETFHQQRFKIDRIVVLQMY
ncbi:TLDc domain-containing protein [Entamoeba marina]